jgi:hypothetical protein
VILQKEEQLADLDAYSRQDQDHDGKTALQVKLS